MIQNPDQTCGKSSDRIGEVVSRIPLENTGDPAFLIILLDRLHNLSCLLNKRISHHDFFAAK